MMLKKKTKSLYLIISLFYYSLTLLLSINKLTYVNLYSG